MEADSGLLTVCASGPKTLTVSETHEAPNQWKRRRKKKKNRHGFKTTSKASEGDASENDIIASFFSLLPYAPACSLEDSAVTTIEEPLAVVNGVHPDPVDETSAVATTEEPLVVVNGVQPDPVDETKSPVPKADSTNHQSTAVKLCASSDVVPVIALNSIKQEKSSAKEVLKLAPNQIVATQDNMPDKTEEVILVLHSSVMPDHDTSVDIQELHETVFIKQTDGKTNLLPFTVNQKPSSDDEPVSWITARESQLRGTENNRITDLVCKEVVKSEVSHESDDRNMEQHNEHSVNNQSPSVPDLTDVVVAGVQVLNKMDLMKREFYEDGLLPLPLNQSFVNDEGELLSLIPVGEMESRATKNSTLDFFEKEEFHQDLNENEEDHTQQPDSSVVILSPTIFDPTVDGGACKQAPNKINLFKSDICQEESFPVIVNQNGFRDESELFSPMASTEIDLSSTGNGSILDFAKKDLLDQNLGSVSTEQSDEVAMFIIPPVMSVPCATTNACSLALNKMDMKERVVPKDNLCSLVEDQTHFILKNELLSSVIAENSGILKFTEKDVLSPQPKQEVNDSAEQSDVITRVILPPTVPDITAVISVCGVFPGYMDQVKGEFCNEKSFIVNSSIITEVKPDASDNCSNLETLGAVSYHCIVNNETDAAISPTANVDETAIDKSFYLHDRVGEEAVFSLLELKRSLKIEVEPLSLLTDKINGEATKTHFTDSVTGDEVVVPSEKEDCSERNLIQVPSLSLTVPILPLHGISHQWAQVQQSHKTLCVEPKEQNFTVDGFEQLSKLTKDADPNVSENEICTDSDPLLTQELDPSHCLNSQREYCVGENNALVLASLQLTSDGPSLLTELQGHSYDLNFSEEDLKNAKQNSSAAVILDEVSSKCEGYQVNFLTVDKVHHSVDENSTCPELDHQKVEKPALNQCLINHTDESLEGTVGVLATVPGEHGAVAEKNRDALNSIILPVEGIIESKEKLTLVIADESPPTDIVNSPISLTLEESVTKEETLNTSMNKSIVTQDYKNASHVNEETQDISPGSSLGLPVLETEDLPLINRLQLSEKSGKGKPLPSKAKAEFSSTITKQAVRTGSDSDSCTDSEELCVVNTTMAQFSSSQKDFKSVSNEMNTSPPFSETYPTEDAEAFKPIPGILVLSEKFRSEWKSLHEITSHIKKTITNTRFTSVKKERLLEANKHSIAEDTEIMETNEPSSQNFSEAERLKFEDTSEAALCPQLKHKNNAFGTAAEVVSNNEILMEADLDKNASSIPADKKICTAVGDRETENQSCADCKLSVVNNVKNNSESPDLTIIESSQKNCNSSKTCRPQEDAFRNMIFKTAYCTGKSGNEECEIWNSVETSRNPDGNLNDYEMSAVPYHLEHPPPLQEIAIMERGNRVTPALLKAYIEMVYGTVTPSLCTQHQVAGLVMGDEQGADVARLLQDIWVSNIDQWFFMERWKCWYLIQVRPMASVIFINQTWKLSTPLKPVIEQAMQAVITKDAVDALHIVEVEGLGSHPDLVPGAVFLLVDRAILGSAAGVATSEWLAHTKDRVLNWRSPMEFLQQSTSSASWSALQPWMKADLQLLRKAYSSGLFTYCLSQSETEAAKSQTSECCSLEASKLEIRKNMDTAKCSSPDLTKDSVEFLRLSSSEEFMSESHTADPAAVKPTLEDRQAPQTSGNMNMQRRKLFSALCLPEFPTQRLTGAELEAKNRTLDCLTMKTTKPDIQKDVKVVKYPVANLNESFSKSMRIPPSKEIPTQSPATITNTVDTTLEEIRPLPAQGSKTFIRFQSSKDSLRQDHNKSKRQLKVKETKGKTRPDRVGMDLNAMSFMENGADFKTVDSSLVVCVNSVAPTSLDLPLQQKPFRQRIWKKNTKYNPFWNRSLERPFNIEIDVKPGETAQARQVRLLPITEDVAVSATTARDALEEARGPQKRFRKPNLMAATVDKGRCGRPFFLGKNLPENSAETNFSKSLCDSGRNAEMFIGIAGATMNERQLQTKWGKSRKKKGPIIKPA